MIFEQKDRKPEFGGGVEVHGRSGDRSVVMYILPAGDQFRFINPFDLSNTQGELYPTFDEAMRLATSHITKAILGV